MAWVPLAAMAVSTVMSAKGQQEQSSAQASAAYAQAAQDENQATDYQQMGYQQAKRIRTQGQATQGQATAALAGGGVDVTQGTALDVQRKIDQNSEQDALQSILESDNRATALRAQAATERAAGDNAAAAGKTNALTSVLRGASQATSNWKTAAKS